MAAEQWSATQAAAVVAAEAIAATAAAEVAAEAAATAQAAVEMASEAAGRAAAKATEVAARAVLAAAAAAEVPSELPLAERSARVAAPATAAAKVARCVSAVAAAASTAATEAAAVIGEQLAADIAAAAAAVTFATHHPALADEGPTGAPLTTRHPVDHLSLAARAPAQVLGRAQLLLEEELRRGIANDELRLHYQPIVQLASGRVVGVEALVRWQHPVRGLLGPQAFVDLAERSELVLPLGAWVLQEACRTAVALQERAGPALTVAVNLSGRQISDRGLVRAVQTALLATGCTADRLVFEVTETALVTDMPTAIASLRELRRLGGAVAIDDFGTGYAPLTYLKQLAADDLKIDKSFVAGLGVDAYDTAIVSSLVALAHNLDVRCVAEGVETAGQLAQLQQLGCDFAQGFLFCRPVDARSLTGWLDRQDAGVAGARG